VDQVLSSAAESRSFHVFPAHMAAAEGQQQLTELEFAPTQIAAHQSEVAFCSALQFQMELITTFRCS